MFVLGVSCHRTVHTMECLRANYFQLLCNEYLSIPCLAVGVATGDEEQRRARVYVRAQSISLGISSLRGFVEI